MHSHCGGDWTPATGALSQPAGSAYPYGKPCQMGVLGHCVPSASFFCEELRFLHVDGTAEAPGCEGLSAGNYHTESRYHRIKPCNDTIIKGEMAVWAWQETYLGYEHLRKYK